jgi:ABC-type phosphate transport system substrate-binding protein
VRPTTSGLARLDSGTRRKEGGLIELPAVLIGIVPIYNLPEVHQEIRISGEVLAEIFLGEVKTWDAPSIAKINPNVSLPSVQIRVINRPAGKGSKLCVFRFSLQGKFQVSCANRSDCLPEVAS